MLEVALGLICSSVPALKPFARHFQFEDRLRRLFRLPARIRSSQKEEATETLNYPSGRPLFSRVQLERFGSIFDGNGDDLDQGRTASSLAQVTWTTDPTPIPLHSRFSKSFDKSIKSISEHELHDVHDSESAATTPSEDRMFINVRQSVTIERKESGRGHG